MGYPTDTDYPGALDTLEDRTDNVDIVWAADYDFQDKQIRRLQAMLGETGKMIGENIAGAGLAGMVSAVASGGTAFKLAARNAFAGGELLSLVDDFDGTPQQKARVNYAGRFWAAAGIDINDSDFFHMPTGGTLPTGLSSSDAGRQFFKTGTSAGLYVFDGSTWALLGGAWEGYMDAASDYSYTQATTPVEEVAGQFVFDGSKVAPGMKAVFRAIFTPSFSSAGYADVRLYDLGAVGSPAAPRLVSTLQRTASGIYYLDQDLTVVSSSPTTNEILNAAHMYEITLFMSSIVSDTIYLGSAGMNIELV